MCIFSDRQLNHEKCGVEAGLGAAGCELCGWVLSCEQRCTVGCGVCELCCAVDRGLYTAVCGQR